MEENKKMFVEKLGSLIIRQTRTGKNIKNMYYERGIPHDIEYVIIEYISGNIKKINVTGDSCMAIMHDIYNVLG